MCPSFVVCDIERSSDTLRFQGLTIKSVAFPSRFITPELAFQSA